MTRKTRISLCLAAAIACGLMLGTAPVAQAQVVAVVYGEPITAIDISARARLEQMSGSKVSGQKDILDLLINDKLKVREARRFSINVTEQEVDDAFSGMAGRMRLKPEQLSEQMSRSGTSAAAVKSRLRAEMAWQRLVRGRFSSTLTVGEQDILNALGSQSTGTAMGYEYTLRPILFVVPEGSGEGTYEARKREAEALRGRFQDCESGVRLARGLRDVAVRERIVKSSADLPPSIRSGLESMQIGRLTAPEISKHGVELFALCDKVETRADTPQKREARDKLFAERFDEQAKKYLADIRRAALIEYK